MFETVLIWRSLNPRSLATTMLISRSSAAVSAVPMSTQSTEAGARRRCQSASATRVVGKAVKVGDAVTTCKLGDRVGVGAQIWACLKCPQCKSDNENYCPHQVDTYGAPYPKEVDPDETITQGGYSSHIRAHEYFVFPIPDAIPSHLAAPMLCAGLTTWSPLVRAGVGPGKKVGNCWLGWLVLQTPRCSDAHIILVVSKHGRRLTDQTGLGHFAVIWANALGAEVTVISHSPHKKDDALKLGAKEFVTNNEKGWADKYQFAFDFVLNTADMTHTFDLSEYLSLCRSTQLSIRLDCQTRLCHL